MGTSPEETLELFAEELSEEEALERNYSCCWGSAACFGTVGCFGSTASTGSCASTAACAC